MDLVRGINNFGIGNLMMVISGVCLMYLIFKKLKDDIIEYKNLKYECRFGCESMASTKAAMKAHEYNCPLNPVSFSDDQGYFPTKVQPLGVIAGFKALNKLAKG